MLWAAEGRGSKSRMGRPVPSVKPPEWPRLAPGRLRVLSQLRTTHRAGDPALNYVQFMGQFLRGPGFLMSTLVGISNWSERGKAGLSNVLCCGELGARRLCSEMLLETLERD